jgi:hypothetical protein
MSDIGHSRRFGGEPVTSRLHPTSDMSPRGIADVLCEQATSRMQNAKKEKPPQRRLFNSNLMLDQTAINAGFGFLQYS